MGHRAKVKNNPIPIYRSRQAGRTDIEELLGPAFNPHQRLTTDVGDSVSLPHPENISEQLEQSLISLDTLPLSTVDSGSQIRPQPGKIELHDPSAQVPCESIREISRTSTDEPSTTVTDSVDSGSRSGPNNSKFVENLDVKSLSTVGSERLSTVDTGQNLISPRSSLGTVDSEDISTSPLVLEKKSVSTVNNRLPTVPSDYGSYPQWITEQGQVVSEKQVRPFKMAQEVLNSNERVLYTVLWNHKEAKLDPQNPHIRTVQRLIPRLMQKDFIRLNETPDFYNRVAASYKVFSYKHVLEVAAEQGRTHVAKLGHGIAFVRKYPNPPEIRYSESLGTVDGGTSTTVAQKSTVSVPSDPLTTVVRKSTILEIRTDRKGGTTTAPPELFDRLESLVPEIDSAAVERIWREGREAVEDIQPDEIAYWFEQRARMVYRNRGLNNPLGLLLSSIQDWLTERKVVARRNQLRELAEEEQRVRKQLQNEN
jgi:hypothetical protein